MTNEDKLAKAKMTILADSDSAFYAVIMCSLSIRLSEDTPYSTAHTTGKEIVISPTFLSKLSVAETVFLIMHELLHVVFHHITRREGRNAEKWNRANDYWINSFLQSLAHKIIKSALLDKKYPHTLSSNEIYEMLPDEPESEDVLGGDLIEPKEDLKELESITQTTIIHAITQARMLDAIGSVPASVLMDIEAYLNPILPWFTILQKYMNSLAKYDYSWKRRNRRNRKIYLPSCHSEKMGELDFYIDLSSSVSATMLALQLGQITWIKNNLEPSKINIITFNTKIIDVFTFHAEEKIQLDLRGTGGTSIKEVVERMSKNTAQVSIVMTDGHFYQPPMNKVYHDILWMIYDNDNYQALKGKVVYVPKKAVHK